MMIDLSELMFTAQGICFPYPHFMPHCPHHLQCSMRMHKAKFQVLEVWDIEPAIIDLHFIFLVFEFISRMIGDFNVIQMRLKLRFLSLMVWVLWRMFLAH